MVACQPSSRLAARLMICIFVSSSVTWLGCNSDVGTAPSAKNETAAFLAKEAEKKPQVTGGSGVPKNIKVRVFKGTDVPK
jgi:hypothetical protein